MADPYSDLSQYVAGVVQWESFADSLRGTEHIPPEAQEYLSQLLGACGKRQYLASSGEVYYRARLMPAERQFDAEPLPLEEMGAPPASLCKGGRLNSEGAPCLYMASSPRTAISEIRPWRAARVTVAEFRTNRDLRCVDLRGVVEEDDPTQPVHWLGFMIARPVHRDDDLAYCATQVVAARLAEEGYEGVLYPSALDPAGYNLALFDCAAAVGRRASLREVVGVHYDDTVLGGAERFGAQVTDPKRAPGLGGIASYIPDTSSRGGRDAE